MGKLMEMENGLFGMRMDRRSMKELTRMGKSLK